MQHEAAEDARGFHQNQITITRSEGRGEKSEVIRKRVKKPPLHPSRHCLKH